MTRKRLAGRFLRTTMLGGVAAAAAMPAMAQEDVDEVVVSDTIIVTGSRLNQANIDSPSPVTTIDAELFDVRGTVDTIDLVNTLPQVTPAQTTAFANGANGTSTIDLRGLGPVRTLVLANGKRLPFGSPTQGGFASDVNLIPSQLVERVEIVTGGASAVYGSDAVAGVANFILRRDFEGIEIDGLFGFNQSNNNSEIFATALTNFGEDPIQGGVSDNATYDISGIIGSNLDNGRGNVTAYFRYLRNNGVQQGDRDFARCATFTNGAGDLVCGGSNQGPFPTSFVLGATPISFNPDGSPATIDVFDVNGNPVFTSDDLETQLTNTPSVALVGTDGMPLNPATLFTNDGDAPFFDQNGVALADGAQLFDSMGNPISLNAAAGSFSLNSDQSLSSGLNNAFNFNPFNPIRRSVERFNAGFSSYYEIAENVEAYMDFGFTQSNSPQIIAPSAAFGSSINQVNCDNPLLSAEQIALICGVETSPGVFSRDTDGDGFGQTEVRRRFVEGGNRTDDRTLTNFRIVGGFKGTLNDNWDWDVFGQFGSTSLARLQTNQVTLTNLQRSLDIVDDGNGNPVCRSVVDGTDPSCVAFVTAFDPNAPVDADALREYVDTPTLTQGSIQQTVFGATFQGDLGQYGFQSPFAEEGISALVGVEYRRDQLQTQADATNQQNLLVGAGGAVNPTNGSTEVYEFFFETAIPLISGLPLAEEVNLTGAYRRSEYSSTDLLNGVTGGNFGTNTFAVGLSWRPVEDIRLRGQFQRAVRAPNVGELFLPVNTNLVTLDDPCSGFTGSPDAPTATLAQCANTGVTAAQFGAIPPDSGQLNVLIGGNPNLSPETADTFTVGAVIQPRWVDGLTVSVDYFNIDVADIISNIPAAQSLDFCLNTGDPQFCNLINRGSDGSLTTDEGAGSFIVTTSDNIAQQSTEGIDLQIAYDYDIGEWGSLNFNFVSTYVLSLEQISVPGTGAFDCAGFFSNACSDNDTSVNFEYRHNFSTTYVTPWDVRISALWRYLGGVDQVDTIDQATGVVTPVSDGSIAASLDAQSYLDVALFWDATENIELRFGVNNVLDNDPPIVPTFDGISGNIEANTFAGTYDAAGRFIFVGANLRF